MGFPLTISQMASLWSPTLLSIVLEEKKNPVFLKKNRFYNWSYILLLSFELESNFYILTVHFIFF